MNHGRLLGRQRFPQRGRQLLLLLHPHAAAPETFSYKVKASGTEHAVQRFSVPFHVAAYGDAPLLVVGHQAFKRSLTAFLRSAYHVPGGATLTLPGRLGASLFRPLAGKSAD